MRININEVDNYNTSNNSEFFTLKNDKDTATVHFLAESIDDLDVLVVHKIKDGDKDRYVSCLRHAGDPIDYCPLCNAGLKPDVRVFVQMYDVESKTVKVWDRGKSVLKLIEPFARRVKPLFKQPFEIERSGKTGDKQTSYQIFALEPDATLPLITDRKALPEKVEIAGVEKTIVLEKPFEDLEYYVQNQKLPASASNQEEPVVRRGNRQTAPEQPAAQTISTPSRKRSY